MDLIFPEFGYSQEYPCTLTYSEIMTFTKYWILAQDGILQLVTCYSLILMAYQSSAYILKVYENWL